MTKFKPLILAFLILPFAAEASPALRPQFQNPDLPVFQNRLDQALYRATKDSNLKRMRILLLAGANPNYRKTNPFKYPTLLVAAIHSGPEAVRLLLEFGADPNARDRRGTPILLSVISFLSPQKHPRQFIDSALALLQGGANPNARDKAYIGDGRAALHLAALYGNRELIENLIWSGADPNLRNTNHETPLHFAAEGGQIGAAQILLENGANPHLSSRYTRATPLMLAAEKGHSKMVALLVSQKVQINSKDTFGKTPLQRAKIAFRQSKTAPIDQKLRFYRTIRVLRKAEFERLLQDFEDFTPES